MLNKIKADDVRTLLPRREMNASKFDCGRALLICGSSRYIGAPYFAAQACVNSGCGLCYLTIPDEILPVLGAKLNEPIFLPRKEIDCSCAKFDAVLVGPGLSREEAARDLVLDIIENAEVPTVVDADALFFTATCLDCLKKAKSIRILTPHEGEFMRLAPEFKHDEREKFAVEFAKENGCILVLKGKDTLVCDTDGTCYVNTTGNPGMAKGGSGDVLAGIIVSLLAQGLSPIDAARVSVYIHGLAGDMAQDKFGTLGMTPTDTLNLVKIALKEV